MFLNKAIIDGKILNVIILEVEDEIVHAVIFDPMKKVGSISELHVSQLNNLEKVRELTSNEKRISQNILQAKKCLSDSMKEIFESLSKDIDKAPLSYNDITPLLNNDGYKNLCELISTKSITISETICVNIFEQKIELYKDDLSNFIKILNTPNLTLEVFISMFINTFDLKEASKNQDSEDQFENIEDINDFFIGLSLLHALANHK